MEVLVEYEYTAQEPDELTLQKGDVITNVIQKLDGWWEGSLGSKRGLFPDNFVKVIPDGDAKSKVDDEVFTETVQLRKKPNARRLKALFSYSPEQDDELPLDVGDVIEFISEVEDGWWKGSLKGKTGIFPSNFVEDMTVPTANGRATTPDANKSVETTNKQNDKNRAAFVKEPPEIPVAEIVVPEDEPAPKLPPKPVRDLARCFYPYTAQNEDELELQEGDIVTIVSKNCEDEGWWRGELRGKNGLFPDNFVKIIPPTELQQLQAGTKTQAQGDSPPPKHHPPPPPVSDNPDGSTGSKISKPPPPEPQSQPSPAAFGSVKNKVTPSPSSATNTSSSKVITPTSPHSPANLGFSYLSNLKSTGNIDALLKKGPSPVGSPSEEPASSPSLPVTASEVGDFNAVERNEKQLNHLTAKRAKAPKRRPPSTLLSRENENGEENGVMGSSPTSSIESPHQTGGSSLHNGGSPSDPGNASPLGNHRHSRDMDNNASSLTSMGNNTSTSTPTSITPQSAKPKVLPWMQELKLKQNQADKKRLATSPNPPVSTTTATTNSPSSTTQGRSISGVPNSLLSTSTSSPTISFSTSPAAVATPTTTSASTPNNSTLSPSPVGQTFTSSTSPNIISKISKDNSHFHHKEPSSASSPNLPPTPAAKAPPLPAKPVIPPEKSYLISPSSANVSHSHSNNNNISSNSNTTTPPATNASTVSTVSLKFGRKVTPSSGTAPAVINNTSGISNNYVNTAINSNNTNSNHISSTGFHHINNNTNIPSEPVIPAKLGKGVVSQEFVSHEEHAKLKDRVHLLESELEIVKKQLKLLLERDMSKGHIV